MASIQKRPNDKWRARYRDPAGKEHARHFERKADAQRWLDEVTASMITGQYVDPRNGRITFGKWFEEWSARQDWQPSTVETATRVIESVPFRQTPLSAIRTADVQKWMKSMSDPRPGRPDGLARSTKLMRLQYVRMTFSAAVAEKRIHEDPTAKVKLPKRTKGQVEILPPTSGQLARIIAAADEDFATFIRVCAFAGLRLGEAAGLQLGDVDFLRRSIHVRRQVQGNTRSNARVCAPKYGSTRTVHVPAQLVDDIAAHVQRFGVRGPDQWLFSREGHVHNRLSAGHLWRRARTAAGVPEFTLHDCRHYYASGLIAATCDVVTVQKALGHSSPTVTLNIYAHMWPTAEDRTRSAATDLMTEVANPRADSPRTKETK